VAGSSNTGQGPINGINVTPLVDVMLVLLVIFMVTAKLVVAPTTALGVQLPKAASGDAVQVVFSVQLTKDGRRFIDGRVAESDEAIGAQAADALALHPELRAVIQADGDVPHRRVIHVMDLLAQAHVSNIAFAVDAEPDAPPAAPAPPAAAP